METNGAMLQEAEPDAPHPLVAKLSVPPGERPTRDLWAALAFTSLALRSMWLAHGKPLPLGAPSLPAAVALALGCVALAQASLAAMLRWPVGFQRVACGTVAAAGLYAAFDPEEPSWWSLLPVVLMGLLYVASTADGVLLQLHQTACRVALSHTPLSLVNAVSAVVTVCYLRLTLPMASDHPFLFAFGGLWFWLVASNVVAATAVGVAARDFLGVAPTQTKVQRVAVAFSCAMTSFGSICFGSLFTAVGYILSWAARAAAAPNKDDGLGAIIVKGMIRFFAMMFEEFVRRFGKYSLTNVALTGNSFLEAARDTAQLMEEHPHLEKIVAGHGMLPSIISALFTAVLVYPAVAAVTPAMAPLAASLAMGLHFTAVSSVYEGFPTTVFLCSAEAQRARQSAAAAVADERHRELHARLAQAAAVAAAEAEKKRLAEEKKTA